MKKLMIVAAVAMLGVAANAAAVSWSVTNVQGSPKTEAAAGWYIQLFNSDVEYSYEAAKAGTITARFTGATVATTAEPPTYKASDKVMGAAVASETVSLYMVIYDAATIKDAKSYIVSSVVSKTVPVTGSDISIGFGSMKGTTTANAFLSSEWKNVPEPTSALLMLLGVAGLALRRKQK